MAKENYTTRFDAELKNLGKQLAKHERRSFTSLLEMLLEQEIAKAIKKGVEFEKYVE